MTNEELVYLYQQGDKQVLEKLLKQNTGIVYKIANKFYVEGTNSMDKEDLEQEGFIGLMIAAQKYDFNNTKKAKFSTYAIHWVYQRISRYVNKKNTNDEVSLNTPIGEEEHGEMLDTIPDDNNHYENVEDKIYKQQLREELEAVMSQHNTLQERQVLKLRHGWDGNKPMKIAEIGHVFNVTISKARVIENRAYWKLRRTSWGVAKAKEIYDRKEDSSILGTIERISFAERYLCDKVM